MSIIETNKDQVARQIIKVLKQHYPDPKPLLHYNNAFELVVATILAAQCTDERVNQVTPDLFKLYPTAQRMSQAPLENLEKLIHSTGFFRNKARNLKKLALALHSSYNNVLPNTVEELIKLPGVGRKTANVITSHLYNKPSIIVDTHFKRVSRRLGMVSHKEPGKIEKEVKALLSPDIWTNFSSLINYHGRFYCKARKPLCFKCPVSNLCTFSDKTNEN